MLVHSYSGTLLLTKLKLAQTEDCLGLFAVANHQGKAIIVTGGCIEMRTTRQVLRFDLDTNEMTELPMMNECRYHHSCATADNMVAVFGGHGGYELLQTIEMIDLTSENTWHTFASKVFTARMYPVVSTVGPSLILVCGGSIKTGE